MRTLLLTVVAMTAVLTLAPSVCPAGSGPISLTTGQAKIQGNTVTLPVRNNTTSAVNVEVIAQFHDGSEVHTGSTVISLAAKETILVAVTLESIVDDIDPQTAIIETPDPIPYAMTLNTN